MTLHAGPSSSFTSIAIIAGPRHGRLVKTGVSGLIYTASAGYKGSDSASVKFCGKGRNNGCSTVTYNFVMN